MSWLFGLNKNQQPQINIQPPEASDPNASTGGSAGSSGGGDNKKPVGAETQYRFDSAALERAAQAARELERTKNSKEILELSRAQEKTKQMELEKQIAEYHAHQEELKMKQSQILAEERRKLLEEETRHQQEVFKDKKSHN